MDEKAEITAYPIQPEELGFWQTGFENMNQRTGNLSIQKSVSWMVQASSNLKCPT
jgi:hypothetical protein